MSKVAKQDHVYKWTRLFLPIFVTISLTTVGFLIHHITKDLDKNLLLHAKEPYVHEGPREVKQELEFFKKTVHVKLDDLVDDVHEIGKAVARIEGKLD